MTRPRLDILVLSDDRPGHYHLADGVVAALGRIADVEVRRLSVKRRGLVPGRLLRWAIARGFGSPRLVLGVGYGLDGAALGRPNLVISAGGETMAANAAAARLVGAANIFCGSLRSLPAEHFTLVVTSYARFAGAPRHLVTLKPSAIDPDSIGRPADVPVFGAGTPPARIGLLVGGNSGLFHYRREEWLSLIAFVRDVSDAWGSKWLISTSRRTEDWLCDTLAGLAADERVVERFIDYRQAGPGTLPQLLAAADVIVCTEDSSTMLSEAISARLPVVGVAPQTHAFKPEEAEYRDFLMSQGWCRGVSLSALDRERFTALLAEIEPLSENPLDKLARELRARLPADLWTGTPAGP